MKQILYVTLLVLIVACNQKIVDTNKINELNSRGATDEEMNPDRSDSAQYDFTQTKCLLEKSLVFDEQLWDRLDSARSIDQLKSFIQGQRFTINPNRDTVIFGMKGTSIFIPKGTFTYINRPGNPVTNTVAIGLKEYQSLQDFVFSNMSTETDDSYFYLETGGSAYVEAFEGNEQLTLMPGKAIEVGFPTSDPQEDMTDFRGSMNAVSNVSWFSEMETRKVISDYFGYMATFRFMDSEFLGNQINNTFYPRIREKIASVLADSLLNATNRKPGTVEISYVISENGETEQVRLIKGLIPELDSALIDMIGEMTWETSAHMTSIRMGQMISISFKNSDRRRYKEAILFPGTFIDQVLVEKTKVLELDNIYRHVLSVDFLGYINCDRFQGDPRPRIYVDVPKVDADAVDVSLYFAETKSVMRAHYNGRNHQFINIPEGIEATLLVVREKNGNLEYAATNITCGRQFKMASFLPLNSEEMMTRLEESLLWQAKNT